jgi:hypothetical protein
LSTEIIKMPLKLQACHQALFWETNKPFKNSRPSLKCQANHNPCSFTSKNCSKEENSTSSKL